MNGYYVAMIITIIFAICGFMLALTGNDNDDFGGGMFILIIMIILTIILYNLGNKQYKKDYSTNTQQYNIDLKNKQYSESMTKINALYINKIDTNDNNTYIINKDSDIKNLNDFKPDEKVDIYYINDADNNHVIIKINKIN